MEHLHPQGWEHLATNDALSRVEDSLTTKIENLDYRLSAEIKVLDANLRGSMHREMRLNTLVTVGILGTLTTVVSAVT